MTVTVTAAALLALPDLRVEDGLSRTVCALMRERDAAFPDLWSSDPGWTDEAAFAALRSRLTTRVKEEEIVDDGDGRYAIDVVCLDGEPVAVATVAGYDSFDYGFAVLDIEALDRAMRALRDLFRPTVRELTVVDVDADVSFLFPRAETA